MKMKINLKLSCCILFLLQFIFSTGTAQVKDFQLWTDISVKKDLSKHWELSYEQNLRFGSNAGRLDKSYSNLTAGYKITKFLKIDGMYRFVIRNKPDYISYGHTFAFDATLKQKYDPFRFSVRNRLLYKFSDIRSSDNGRIPQRYYRTKLEIGFKTKKFPLNPYFSAESFLFLPIGETPYFDALRATAGLEYALNKHNIVDCYWMNEWGFNTADAEDLYILGVSYSYMF